MVSSGTHGHDSIQWNVILLFPPLVVSPSRGFQGGNLWRPIFRVHSWGIFTLDPWLSLAFCTLVLTHGHPLAPFLHCLALSGFLFIPGTLWPSFCALSGTFWRVSSPFIQKPQEKPLLKTWGKSLGGIWLSLASFRLSLARFGSLWRCLSIPGSLWPFAALSGLLPTLWHSLALSLGPGESLNPRNILSSLS